MALHLPTGPLKKKPALGKSWYRDANPVHTKPVADDLATAPSGPVFRSLLRVLPSCLLLVVMF